MNAPIGDELLQRQPRDLAADWIEARDDYRVGSIVDDDIDASRELEGADVPAFASDDASLHFVIRKRYSRHSRLHALLRRYSLNRQSYDLLGFTFGVPL